MQKISLLSRFKQSGPIIIAAVWFGLFSGLGELFIQAFRKILLHRILGVSLDIVWMAPLIDIIFITIPAVILILINLLWSKLINNRVFYWVFTFIGLLIFLLYLPLHIIAITILSAGLSVWISLFLSQHTRQFQTIVQRSVGWMAALVVGMALIVHGVQWVAENRALSSLPPAKPGAPNVILIVLDTVRASNMSLYGYDRSTTPELESIAKSGVLFEQAISTAPWTLPSHASMFTGRWPHELSADWGTPLNATFPTLAEVLNLNGYATAGFVGNTFYLNREHGLDRGFLHYEDFAISLGQLFISSSIGQNIGCWREQGFGCPLRDITGYYDIPGRKDAAEVNSEFLYWISRNRERPFFAFLNYFDAHAPYLPQEPYDSLFGPKRPQGSPVFLENYKEVRIETPDQIQIEINAYDNIIAYLDHEIGLLLENLRQQGILDKTLVIITSDHGEEFYEHRVMSHGNSLYRESIHVPLLILLPSQVHPNIKIKNVVSLRDIPATIFDLLGIQEVVNFPGFSLTQYWDSVSNVDQSGDDILLCELTGLTGRPEWYPISKGNMKSLFLDGLQYIKNGDGSEELYKYEYDPMEQRNLISIEDKQIIIQFRSLLYNALH
jgi:arylsulfatase A-like enzyme